MASEEIIRLVVTLVGGGVMVWILEWIRTRNAERINREVDYLNQQLRLLYGPLYYFSSENESIHKHWVDIDKAFTESYVKIHYAEAGKAAIDKEVKDTNDLSNRFSAQLVENNYKMVDILNQNYGLIDPDDMEAFQVFRTHVMRHKIEQEVRPPRRIERQLNTINLYDSRFCERLKTQFLAKNERLKQLRQSRSCCGRIQQWWKRENDLLNNPSVEQAIKEE